MKLIVLQKGPPINTSPKVYGLARTPQVFSSHVDYGTQVSMNCLNRKKVSSHWNYGTHLNSYFSPKNFDCHGWNRLNMSLYGRCMRFFCSKTSFVDVPPIHPKSLDLNQYILSLCSTFYIQSSKRYSITLYL